MTRRIVIDPVTRIEGHAKITIHLDDDGRGGRGPLPRHRVPRLRGFCEGRPFCEMPGIIGPHLRHLPGQPPAGLVQGRRPHPGRRRPPAAEKLRRLMNLGQIIQSHALSFFHLSAPDLLLGWDSRRRRGVTSSA